MKLYAHRRLQVLEQNVKTLLEVNVKQLLAIVVLGSDKNLGPRASISQLDHVVRVDDLLVAMFEN